MLSSLDCRRHDAFAFLFVHSLHCEQRWACLVQVPISVALSQIQMKPPSHLHWHKPRARFHTVDFPGGSLTLVLIRVHAEMCALTESNRSNESGEACVASQACLHHYIACTALSRQHCTQQPCDMRCNRSKSRQLHTDWNAHI